MVRIGIIGGTFDPVHNGHIRLAKDAVAQAGLDDVWFMPAKLQPFKLGIPVTAAEHRIAMLDLATEDDETLDVSTLEMEMEGVSYTYRTLREVRKAFEDNGEEVKVYFIVGTDTFVKLDFWTNAEALLTENAFLVGDRPRYEGDGAEAKKKEYEERFGTEVIFLDNEKIDISSTKLREMICRDEDVSAYLPDNVIEYIEKYRLYKPMEREKIEEYVRGQLTDKRWNHTLGVIETAEKLARIYGADVEKASLAALCHDACRKWTDEAMDLFIDEHHLDPYYKGNINLSHSKAAAIVAKERLGILDEDILNAISYHTTGRAGMSLLEKIVFIADAIEPNRKEYPGLMKMRETVMTDIDKACLMSLTGTKRFVEGQGRHLDEDTQKAIDWFGSLGVTTEG